MSSRGRTPGHTPGLAGAAFVPRPPVMLPLTPHVVPLFPPAGRVTPLAHSPESRCARWLRAGCRHSSPARPVGPGQPCQPSQQTSALAPRLAEATFVAVSPESGRAEVDDVLAAIRPTTCLVSIMLANNETGVIMVSLCEGGTTSGTEQGHPRGTVRGEGEPVVPATQTVSSSLLPACRRAEPAHPCPQSAESGRGVAQDPGAHGCGADGWEGARGCAGAGGGLPHHRGTQGVALFPWPRCYSSSQTSLLGC